MDRTIKGLRAAFCIACLKLFTYAFLPAVFYLTLGVDNPQILRPSRTALITLSMFVIGFYMFVRVYGGYDIGKRKSKPIIYSFSTAVVLTDLAAYLQLEIMNVNDAKNDTLILFGGDFGLLIGCIALQLIAITILAYFGNYLYFKLHKPLRCCVITANHLDFGHAQARLRRFRLQYEICDHVDYRDPDIKAAIKRNQVVFLFDVPSAERVKLVEYCYKHRLGVFFSPDVYDIVSISSEIRILDDEMLIGNDSLEITAAQSLIKRTMDIMLSIFGLICVTPLMLIVAAVIRLTDGGKVFYRQKRMTRGGNVFYIYKFRTMRPHEDGEDQMPVREDDPRITRFGRFLRLYRIDEFPQLINILKGEMSFVGPRPEMLENIDRYTKELPEFAYRSRMKAGLTGYAQIAGKYNTPPRQKLLMDLYYISNYNFWLDIKLVLKTILVFFKKDSTQAFEFPSDSEKGG